jgi:FeS assembly protein SufD
MIREDSSLTYTIPEAAPELERGPLWLREKRQKSRESFNKTPLPRRGLHLWRYTDPSKFLVDRSQVFDTTFDDKYDEAARTGRGHVDNGRLSGLVVDHGGTEIISYITDRLRELDVVVSSISEAVDTHQDVVEEYLYRLVNSDTGKFEALNGALWNDGVFVYVPDNTSVEQPLHLLREVGPGDSSVYPRLLVVVGRGARLTLIDEYTGGSGDFDSGTSNCNAAVEIFGLEESQVRYVSLQRHGKATQCYLTHRARIEAGSHMLTVPLAFGASLSKANFGVILNGQAAHSDTYGLLFGSARQRFDNHTLHHHAHSQTTSNIDFKVVLQDKAQSAYTGLIRIDQESRTCEAYQENRNLLLTPGCKAETIPELEILNEDVSCSHGATMGEIDPQMVFYLRCRGIEEEEAIRMIVSGFVGTTISKVPEDLRQSIAEFTAGRLKEI